MRAVAVAVLQVGFAVVDRGFVRRQRRAARLQRCVGAGGVGPVGERGRQELHVLGDAGGAGRVIESLVALHHPRVDDCNADARAVQTGVGGLGRAGAHRAGGGAGHGFERAGGALGLAVRRDELHVAALCDLLHAMRRQCCGEHAQARHGSVDRAAGALDFGPQLAHFLVGVAAHEHHLNRVLAAIVPGPALLVRGAGVDRIAEVLGDLAFVAAARPCPSVLAGQQGDRHRQHQ